MYNHVNKRKGILSGTYMYNWKSRCFEPAAGEKNSGSKVKSGKARRRRKFFQKMRGVIIFFRGGLIFNNPPSDGHFGSNQGLEGGLLPNTFACTTIVSAADARLPLLTLAFPY